MNYEIKNEINDYLFIYDIDSTFTDLSDFYHSRPVYGTSK